MKRGNRIITD